MAASFNQKMVEKLQGILLKNPGADAVTVDGQSVSYADLQERLAYFEGRLARENGKRPRVAKINMEGF